MARLLLRRRIVILVPTRVTVIPVSILTGRILVIVRLTGSRVAIDGVPSVKQHIGRVIPQEGIVQDSVDLLSTPRRLGEYLGVVEFVPNPVARHTFRNVMTGKHPIANMIHRGNEPILAQILSFIPRIRIEMQQFRIFHHRLILFQI